MKTGGAIKIGGAAKINKGQFPSLHLAGYNRGIPSVQRLLETPMLINGLSPDPVGSWIGQDGGGSSWVSRAPAATSLAITGAGADPILVQAPTMDTALNFTTATSKNYLGNADFANPGLSDIVIEAFVCRNSISGSLAFKLDIGETVLGWKVAHNSAGFFLSFLGATAVNIFNAGSADLYRWEHVLWFVKRSGSAVGYQNSIAGSVYDVSASVATNITNVYNFSLGGKFNQTGGSIGNIALFSIWMWPNWLDTHLQATIAKQRFSLLTQSRPLYSYSNIAYPTAQGNSTNPAYQSKLVSGNTQLFYVGVNWSRWIERLDTNSRNFKGMLVESAVKNFIRQSNNLNTYPWSKTGTASVTENTAETTDPMGTYTASKLVGVGNYSANEVRQTSITGLTAGASIALALWIKRISVSGTIVLRNDKLAPGGGKWEINLASLPDKWVRITRSSPYLSVPTEMTADASGTAEFRFWSSTAATFDFYCWGCQLEDSRVEANQDVTTTTVVVTKPADSLYYTLGSADIGSTEGAVYFEFLSPTMTPLTNKFLFSLSAAGSATNALSVYVDTAGKLNVTTASTGGGSAAGAVISATTKANNIWHWGLVLYKANSLKLIIDGTLEGEDTSVDVPVGMNQLRVGNDAANTAGLNAGPILVGNIQCFPTTTDYRIRG